MSAISSSSQTTVEILATIIADRGIQSLSPLLTSKDASVLNEVIEPRGVRARGAWKRRESYQRELIRSQLDPRTDNGSRTINFLEEYCSPILHLLARHSSIILQPGCGCGQWLPFLRKVGNARFIGFDSGHSIIKFARSRFDDCDCEFHCADVLSFPVYTDATVVLLDYEFLNAFDFEEAAQVIDWAYSSLKIGGVVLGDLRLSTFKSTERSIRTLVSPSKSRSVVWMQKGLIGTRYFGTQHLVMAAEPLRIRSLKQDLIRLYNSTEASLLLNTMPWREITLSSLEDIRTDKDECRHNIRFLLRR